MRVNEIFYSIQGEGARTGTANVFVRFAGCNLKCNREEHGFDCDTDFSGGIDYTAEELADKIYEVDRFECLSIIWTGGEPSLQLTGELLNLLPDFYHAIETNGTNLIPERIDWVSVSPKTAEHTLRVGRASELRYVRAKEQALPKPKLDAYHLFVSPAFLPDASIDLDALAWCRKLVMENPKWKLSLQTHKLLTPIR